MLNTVIAGMRDPSFFAFVSALDSRRNLPRIGIYQFSANGNLPSQRLTSSTTTFTSLSAEVSSMTGIVEQSPVVYDAVMPPTETLIGMGVIVVLCVVVSWVWANQVVPTSRTNLVISKSRGEVKDYLDNLKESDPSLVMNETTINSSSSLMDTADNTHGDVDDVAVDSIEEQNPAVGRTEKKDDRAFERWLFSDWLNDNKSARKAGRQKEAALPILKNAKWNSGDNPVLAATALISLGVLFTAVTERIISM